MWGLFDVASRFRQPRRMMIDPEVDQVNENRYEKDKIERQDDHHNGETTMIADVMLLGTCRSRS